MKRNLFKNILKLMLSMLTLCVAGNMLLQTAFQMKSSQDADTMEVAKIEERIVKLKEELVKAEAEAARAKEVVAEKRAKEAEERAKEAEKRAEEAEERAKEAEEKAKVARTEAESAKAEVVRAKEELAKAKEEVAKTKEAELALDVNEPQFLALRDLFIAFSQKVSTIDKCLGFVGTQRDSVTLRKLLNTFTKEAHEKMREMTIQMKKVNALLLQNRDQVIMRERLMQDCTKAMQTFQQVHAQLLKKEKMPLPRGQVKDEEGMAETTSERLPKVKCFMCGEMIDNDPVAVDKHVGECLKLQEQKEREEAGKKSSRRWPFGG